MPFTDDEIRFIKTELLRKGITMESLRSDLVDHLLCCIEEQRMSGVDFQRSYEVAWQNLNGDHANDSIQRETSALFQDVKSLVRNLLLFGGMISTLIIAFIAIRKQPNAALILVCISSGIFFVYHSVFYILRNKSIQNRNILFALITSVPVVGVLLSGLGAVIPNTPGMLCWYILIFLIAIPVYHRVMRTALKSHSTALSFLRQTVEFIAISSFLWTVLAGSLTVIRPDVNVQFIPDLIIQGCFCILLSLCIGWVAARKQVLHSIFHTYVRR